MGTNLYPQSVTNKNVPENVYLIANISTMSGELQETYYIDKEGNMLRVGDWKDDKPIVSNLHQMTKITGDSELMILHRWADYFYWKGKEQ